MRFSFIVILCFFSAWVCFSQNSNSIYNQAVEEYDAESYKQSRQNFKLAKQQFLNQKNISSLVNCLSNLQTAKKTTSVSPKIEDYSIGELEIKVILFGLDNSILVGKII